MQTAFKTLSLVDLCRFIASYQTMLQTNRTANGKPLNTAQRETIKRNLQSLLKQLERRGINQTAKG